jgi:hypothetical protein
METRPTSTVTVQTERADNVASLAPTLKGALVKSLFVLVDILLISVSAETFPGPLLRFKKISGIFK